MRSSQVVSLLIGVLLVVGCQATVKGKPEVLNPKLSIAALPKVDLRAGLYISPQARRYSYREAWAQFEYGAKTTGYAEEHFPRVFRSLKLVGALPPPPESAADLDIVISIDQLNGDFVSGSGFTHAMNLSVPFSIYSPAGTLIRRIDTYETLSVVMASLNPGANLEKGYEAAERLSEAVVMDFLKQFPTQEAAAAAERYRETVSASSAGGRDDQTATIRDKPSVFIAFPKDEVEVAEETVAVFGYITSLNLTDRFRVLVNRLPLSVEELWTDSPIDTKGLRGFPVDLNVPLQMGDNRIELQVLDRQGFLERKTVLVRRIALEEKAAAIAPPTGLPDRLPDVAVDRQRGDVTANNFIAVLGQWVTQTAKTDYNKGNVMFDQGRFARAAYYFRKAIKTSPMGEAWFNLGLSETALGNNAEASEAFSNACRLEISAACTLSS